MSPMKKAIQGSQWSHTPVIETRPASTPLHSAPTSYLRVREYVPMIKGFKKADERPPVAPEIIVHIMIFGALFYLGRNMSIVEPPLKKSELTSRRIVPKTTKGNEFISKLSSY